MSPDPLMIPQAPDAPLRSPPPRRLWLALAFAPLAGPLAIWVCLLFRAAVLPRTPTDAVDNVGSVLVLVFLFLAFGAPLAYAATLVVVVPAFRLLDASERASWWAIAVIGAMGGGLLFPLYLHLLAPHGFFNFFPGAGFIAGAATGLAFWRIATR